MEGRCLVAIGPGGDPVALTANALGQLQVLPLGLTFGPGAFPYSYIAAGSANQDGTVIKAAPGVLKALICVCTVATMRYLKFYDTNVAPTSLMTPVLRVPVPATSTTGNRVEFPMPPEGVRFTFGIAFRMTTGVADSDANAVTASDLVLSAAYL